MSTTQSTEDQELYANINDVWTVQGGAASGVINTVHGLLAIPLVAPKWTRGMWAAVERCTPNCSAATSTEIISTAFIPWGGIDLSGSDSSRFLSKYVMSTSKVGEASASRIGLWYFLNKTGSVSEPFLLIRGAGSSVPANTRVKVYGDR